MRKVIVVAAFAAIVLLSATPVAATGGGGSGWGPGNGQIQVTFTQARSSSLGVATIKVTWSCGTNGVPWTAPVQLDFNMTLIQPVSQTQSVSSNVAGGQLCNPGTPTSLPATFVPPQGMFVAGGATMQATVSGCDQNFNCDTENYAVTVTLH